MVSPENLEPEIGIFAGSLVDSTREWRENLGEVAPEAVYWQPFHNGYSIGALMLHMVSCELWWIDHVSLGRPLPQGYFPMEFDATIRQDEGVWPTPPQEPLEWYYHLQNEARGRVLKSLTELADANRVCYRKEESFTVRWILAHVLEHDSYTGGQAVMLHQIYRQTQCR